MRIKSIRYVVLVCVLAFLLLMVTFQLVLAVAEPDQAEQSLAVSSLSPPGSGWAIPLQQTATTATLQAASGVLLIEFWTLNGDTNAVAAQSSIPHLILHQGGDLLREIPRAPIMTANPVLSFSSLNSAMQKQEAVR